MSKTLCAGMGDVNRWDDTHDPRQGLSALLTQLVFA